MLLWIVNSIGFVLSMSWLKTGSLSPPKCVRWYTYFPEFMLFLYLELNGARHTPHTSIGVSNYFWELEFYRAEAPCRMKKGRGRKAADQQPGENGHIYYLAGSQKLCFPRHALTFAAINVIYSRTKYRTSKKNYTKIRRATVGRVGSQQPSVKMKPSGIGAKTSDA